MRRGNGVRRRRRSKKATSSQPETARVSNSLGMDKKGKKAMHMSKNVVKKLREDN